MPPNPSSAVDTDFLFKAVAVSSTREEEEGGGPKNALWQNFATETVSRGKRGREGALRLAVQAGQSKGSILGRIEGGLCRRGCAAVAVPPWLCRVFDKAQKWFRGNAPFLGSKAQLGPLSPRESLAARLLGFMVRRRGRRSKYSLGASAHTYKVFS